MRKKGEFDFNLIRAMEVFVAVAEIGQVTKAAELLGMTQSAASQQLRALEGAFGSKLDWSTSRFRCCVSACCRRLPARCRRPSCGTARSA